MRMPAHYVDMNRNEMEYDGGFDFWNVVKCAAVAVVVAIVVVYAAPVVCGAAAAAGMGALGAAGCNFAADCAIGAAMDWALS